MTITPASLLLGSEDAALRSYDDSTFDLALIDAPYNSMNQRLKLGSGRIVGDGSADEWFEEWSDHPDDFREFLTRIHRVMKDGSHLFIMFDPMSLLHLGNIVGEHFNTKNLITWNKVNMGMGYHFRRQSEFIIYAQKGKGKLTNKSTSDVWSIKRVSRPTYPTMKPVELYARMIESTLSEPGLILDPFHGSGSSAIAALDAGHSYVGIDISRRAHDIAKERIAHWEAQQ